MFCSVGEMNINSEATHNATQQRKKTLRSRPLKWSRNAGRRCFFSASPFCGDCPWDRVLSDMVQAELLEGRWVVLTVMEKNGGTRKLEAKSQSQSGSGRKGRKVKRGSDGIGIKLYRGVSASPGEIVHYYRPMTLPWVMRLGKYA